MIISLIVAYGRNREIGLNNQLLWHISEDLKNFKRLTLNHILIMGRKTFTSIGHPLPKRATIVLTRDKSFFAEGVYVAHSVEQALALAKTLTDFNQEEIFIAGGAQIYEQFLPLAQRLYITQVEDNFVADTFFPAWEQENWELKSRQEYCSQKPDMPAWSFSVFYHK